MGTDFDLSEFIKDTSELFLVLGVFAATAVYTHDLQGSDAGLTEKYLGYGHGGSLLIVALLTFLIYKEMTQRLGGKFELMRAHLRVKNVELILFSLSYYLLFWSIGWLILDQSSILQIVPLTIIGFFVLGAIMYLFEFLDGNIKSDIKLASILLLLSVVSIVISSNGLIWLPDNYELVTVGTLSLNNAVMMLPTSAFVTSMIVFVMSIIIGIISSVALFSGFIVYAKENISAWLREKRAKSETE
ncbi:hypothetical protein CP556_22175 [Natrinema sp. CBA1119]|uniref:hypothetical protein n=1 Tax=Natrinema sp. CBA1119 TaxID=1608465 RepID=UPI000BF6E2E9|nr:hypothetical protein [Natrinema sp. CBA1119]PGF13818.1 hypothetical protein CP556_22175 [Natrinema sp. CBA1119]